MNDIKKNLNMLGASLSLRAKRNEILASNIANAATPHFKARDIDFDTEIKKYQQDGPIKLHTILTFLLKNQLHQVELYLERMLILA